MPSELFKFSEVPMQPRARWFLQRGPVTQFTRGFSSKASAGEWINELGRRLDWRVGYTFRLRGDTLDMHIVGRDGQVAKAS